MKHKLSFILFMLLFSGAIHADEVTWTGKQSGNWDEAKNWSGGGKVPGAGEHVTIGPLNADTVIMLNKAVKLKGLSFNPKGTFSTDLKGEYMVLGDKAVLNFLKLPKDVGMRESATQTISSDLELSGEVVFKNQNRWYLGGERLRIAGDISGHGKIIITGTYEGTVEFAGDNSMYEGDIEIASGSLLVSNRLALSSSSDPIRMRGGIFNIHARISTTKDFIIEKDAAWTSLGPNGSHDGTITVAKDATWTIKNGGGNTMTLTGIIQGTGNVKFTAHGTTFGSAKANRLTGTTIIGGNRGQTMLGKPDNTTAIAGAIQMVDMGTLQWKADHQVADTSMVTFAGKQPTLAINGHQETLGVLNLQSDGRIDLGGDGGRLAFANSSQQKWNANHILLIENCGQAEALRFGNSGKGLTAGQLKKIGFVNPENLPKGTYMVKLTSDGYLIPSGELVKPVNLPIDLSKAAIAKRKADYDIRGLEKLTGRDSPLAENMTIAFFGDSITWTNGYVTLIRNAINQSTHTKSRKIKLVNHGINGGGALTVRDGDKGTAHFGNTKPLPFAETIATDKADVAVVFIGVNDVWWRKTTAAQFEQALRDIVSQARKNKTRPVLATLAMLKEAVGQRNPKCDAFAEITRKVAKDTNTTLVDLRSAFFSYLENESITIRPDGTWKSDGTILAHDGVHTNATGNMLLANLIADGIYRSLKK